MSQSSLATIAPVLALAAITAVALFEALARRLRLADYALYRRSEVCEYEPRPGSSGLMLRRYRWQFNAMGARLDGDDPLDRDGIVLVGDSIIEGGSKVDQGDTVGYQLAAITGRRVYPVGAGGWSLPNEVSFLLANPEFLITNHFIFVVNRDDLSAANRWKSIYEHPIEQPKIHLAYLAGRLAHIAKSKLRRPTSHDRDILPHDDAEWRASLERFLAAYRGRVTIFRYPDIVELKSGTQSCQELNAFASERVRIVDLAHCPSWGDDCYQDRFHPSAKGRLVLAQAIGGQIPEGTLAGPMSGAEP